MTDEIEQPIVEDEVSEGVTGVGTLNPDEAPEEAEEAGEDEAAEGEAEADAAEAEAAGDGPA